MDSANRISEWNALGLPLGGKTSGQIKTPCPFCRETRKKKNDPSLSVNIETGMYTCHHCGTSGNIHKFTAMKPEKTYQRPAWKNKTELSTKTVQWFESRKISQEAVKKLQITEGEEYMPQVKQERNTVQFNYFEQGQLVNIKYRDGEKNFKMFKDGKLIWYNMDSITGDSAIIVEGEMDVLAYVTAGVDNVISLPNGANNCDFFDPEWLDEKRVYVAVDNDKAGYKCKQELIRRIGAERCLIVDFKDCKDANDYLIKYGRNALRETIDKAKEIPVEGVVFMDDMYLGLLDLYQNGMKPGLPTRHNRLSEHLTFETSRLMVVTGIPGHGKSEWVDEIAVQLNTLHGWRWGFFTPENHPTFIHASKLIAKLSGQWISRLTQEELEYYALYLNDNFFWVLPKDEEYSLDVILAKARFLVRKHGIKAFVIDPWNTIEHTYQDQSETQFISKALGKIANFARQNDILMVLVAHPRKMDKAEGEFDIPNLYSISGSAHFFNKADYGVTVYRRSNDLVEIHVQKVKFRHLGTKGMIAMMNNSSNGRYQECGAAGFVTDWKNDTYIIKHHLNQKLGG